MAAEFLDILYFNFLFSLLIFFTISFVCISVVAALCCEIKYNSDWVKSIIFAGKLFQAFMTRSQKNEERMLL